MGGTRYDDDVYYQRQAVRSQSGQSAFAYDAGIKSGEYRAGVHDKMNPMNAMRESRDSEKNPNSTPIIVAFDVTGSMGVVPEIVQKQLPKLMGLLQRKSYVPDPSILIAGIGDAYTDTAPVQVGQFESGNEIEDDLSRIWLEGGGGGQVRESYELMVHFALHHTVTDAWEKRKKKGYLFLIGDEMCYESTLPAHLKSIFGDDADKSHNDVKELFSKASERWNIYFILPNMTSYWSDDRVSSCWKRILGERFVKLEDPSAICDLIVSLVGSNEGVSIDRIVGDLKSYGSTATDIVAKATSSASGVSTLPGVSGVRPRHSH